MSKSMKRFIIALYIIVSFFICAYCIFRISDISYNYKEEEYYVWAFHQTSVNNIHFFTSEIGYLTYESEEFFENSNYILVINNNKTNNIIKDDYVIDVICLHEQTDSSVSENSECF